MRNSLVLGLVLGSLVMTSFASNSDYINVAKCGESTANIFYSCNKLQAGTFNPNDCQCLPYPPSNDDKYADIGLTLNQVQDFLTKIKVAATSESDLLQYVGPLYTWKNKNYFGNLNCSNRSNKLTHIPLTTKFVREHYSAIFDEHILNTIKLQTESAIFVRDNGFMFGDGQLWFYVGDKKNIVINAVNLDTHCPDR